MANGNGKMALRMPSVPVLDSPQWVAVIAIMALSLLLLMRWGFRPLNLT